MRTNLNSLFVIISSLLILSACSFRNEEVKQNYVFMHASPQWPMSSGDMYYEISGNDFCFMEDIFLADFKKLYRRSLNPNEYKKLNEIVGSIKEKQLNSINIDNYYSESATEYHLTISLNTDNYRDILIFQDELDDDFVSILSFLDSLRASGSFDTIVSTPEVRNLFFDGVISHSNDTIRTNKRTNFCLWKYLMTEELLIVEDAILETDMDYSFYSYYDLGFTGDSITKVGVLNEDLYLFFKSGMVKKVNDMPCSPEPLLY